MKFGRWISLIFSLVKRDYAVQYAGTSLGIAWLIIQNLFQVGIFYLLFGFILGSNAVERPATSASGMGSGKEYLVYLLGGMSLWLPLSEMLIRSCGILSENRSLIRRTSIGISAFMWIPVFEAVLHYAIIFFPSCLIAYYNGRLSGNFLFAFAWGVGVIVLFSGWGFILARVSVLLKDVSPLLRLVLQIVFWATPIVYMAPENLLVYFQWNPFFFFMDYHRQLFSAFDPVGFLLHGRGLGLFLVLSIPAYVISGRKLSALISDHI